MILKGQKPKLRNLLNLAKVPEFSCLPLFPEIWQSAYVKSSATGSVLCSCWKQDPAVMTFSLKRHGMLSAITMLIDRNGKHPKNLRTLFSCNFSQIWTVWFYCLWQVQKMLAEWKTFRSSLMKEQFDLIGPWVLYCLFRPLLLYLITKGH